MDILTSNSPKQYIRKRKPEYIENNERLSKRMSLLNLERNGQNFSTPSELSTLQNQESTSSTPLTFETSNFDPLQIEDSKHKVYIHNLDAEILQAESEERKLFVFPDIEKHIRDYRISPSIIIPANNQHEDKQMVLYNVPTSLTVSEEFDNVRRVILETRARAREKQEIRCRETQSCQSSVEPMNSIDEKSSSSYNRINGTQYINGQLSQDHDPDSVDFDMMM